MRIQAEDDLVVVIYANTKEELYKGLEDYEDLKREDWKWNEIKKYYELVINGRKLIKKRVG